jgi:hypothetical protein
VRTVSQFLFPFHGRSVDSQRGGERAWRRRQRPSAAAGRRQRGRRTTHRPSATQRPSAAAGRRIVPARHNVQARRPDDASSQRGTASKHGDRTTAAQRRGFLKIIVPIFDKRRSASVPWSVPVRSCSSFRDEIPGTRNAPSFLVPCH